MHRYLQFGWMMKRRSSLWRSLSSTVEHVSSSSPSSPLPRIPFFDHTPQPYTGPSAQEILAKRKEFLNPSIFYYYKKPVCAPSLLNHIAVYMDMLRIHAECFAFDWFHQLLHVYASHWCRIICLIFTWIWIHIYDVHMYVKWFTLSFHGDALPLCWMIRIIFLMVCKFFVLNCPHDLCMWILFRSILKGLHVHMLHIHAEWFTDLCSSFIIWIILCIGMSHHALNASHKCLWENPSFLFDILQRTCCHMHLTSPD